MLCVHATIVDMFNEWSFFRLCRVMTRLFLPDVKGRYILYSVVFVLMAPLARAKRQQTIPLRHSDYVRE